MGRIVTSVRIDSISDSSKTIRCDALVDTGATFMVLPSAWKERLGPLDSVDTVDMSIANQEMIKGEICGPVRIQIEGFRPVYTEIVFVDMKPDDGTYEPLIGYLVLEQCQAVLDMVGHRLVHVKSVDLK